MVTNPLQLIREHSDRIRDLAGFGFFLFATLISGLAAWQHPSILAWLFAIHNGLLAFFYTRRTAVHKKFLHFLEKCLPLCARLTKNQSLAQHPVKGDGLWFDSSSQSC